jgi:hypothetical protein
MPLARYFLYVGGVLFALLLISNAVLPNLPVADGTGASLPVIRIHSDRKWPERVVFDTNLPTITPAPTAKVEAPPAPATVADVSATARVHDSFAQLQPADEKHLETTSVKKPAPKPQPKRKIAKKRAPPPVMLVAQQPRFGWFDNGAWSNTW